ncbi:MAG: hypothetical protein QOJ39_66, partial [Candidatus Eremiobacteraeota bacterium]|nr:hypothetical protein [Candidatus Eremiobacteraeota bacterium]
MNAQTSSLPQSSMAVGEARVTNSVTLSGLQYAVTGHGVGFGAGAGAQPAGHGLAAGAGDADATADALEAGDAGDTATAAN